MSCNNIPKVAQGEDWVQELEFFDTYSVTDPLLNVPSDLSQVTSVTVNLKKSYSDTTSLVTLTLADGDITIEDNKMQFFKKIPSNAPSGIYIFHVKFKDNGRDVDEGPIMIEITKTT